MYKLFLALMIAAYSCSSPQKILQPVDYSSSEFNAGSLSLRNGEVLKRIIYFAKQDVKDGKKVVIIANGNCPDEQIGTGKTLTAALIENLTGREVYRIDLSQVVSKYIGETEKNLHKELQEASKNKFILWFDEADVLFGKRTNVTDAHDRYQNIDIDYLLKSIEKYRPLAILFSNYKVKPDEAIKSQFDLWIDLACEAE